MTPQDQIAGEFYLGNDTECRERRSKCLSSKLPTELEFWRWNTPCIECNKSTFCLLVGPTRLPERYWLQLGPKPVGRRVPPGLVMQPSRSVCRNVCATILVRTRGNEPRFLDANKVSICFHSKRIICCARESLVMAYSSGDKIIKSECSLDVSSRWRVNLNCFPAPAVIQSTMEK